MSIILFINFLQKICPYPFEGALRVGIHSQMEEVIDALVDMIGINLIHDLLDIQAQFVLSFGHFLKMGGLFSRLISAIIARRSTTDRQADKPEESQGVSQMSIPSFPYFRRATALCRASPHRTMATPCALVPRRSRALTEAVRPCSCTMESLKKFFFMK